MCGVISQESGPIVAKRLGAWDAAALQPLEDLLHAQCLLPCAITGAGYNDAAPSGQSTGKATNRGEQPEYRPQGSHCQR
jgi:hypothetical protein